MLVAFRFASIVNLRVNNPPKRFVMKKMTYKWRYSLFIGFFLYLTFGIVMIFEHLSQSVTVSRVSKMLNDQGVLTRKRLLWIPAVVRRIAKSEVYVGDLFFNKTQTIYVNGNKVIINISSSEYCHDLVTLLP